MSSISRAARHQALACRDSCPETRRRCTTPVRRNGEHRIPDRLIWAWSTVRSARGYNGTFLKMIRRWHVENWTRRLEGAVYRRVFSTATELPADCPEKRSIDQTS